MSPKASPSAAQDGFTITFEHCTTRPFYPETHSGRSSPAQSSSPSTPTDPPSNYPTDPAVDTEDSWNLIPYDVPWGPEYYHYRTGTLPGPDGACIFLRSPTPLKNRRTQKACNKCRQRKAKCSGDHPACTRCLARGYICEYVDEEKGPAHGAETSRHSRPRDSSEDISDDSKESSPEADYPPCTAAPQLAAPRPLKVEEPDLAPPDLLYYDSATATASGSSSPSTAYGSPWDDTFFPAEASYGFHSPASDPYDQCGVADFYEPPPPPSYTMDPEMHAYQPHQPSPTYFHHPALAIAGAPPSAAVHAPRPVRCTGSPSFLAPEERPPVFSSSSPSSLGCEAQMFAHSGDDMLIDLCSPAEPAPQIAIPQLPPMPSAHTPAVHSGGGALHSYPDPHAMYYCPPPPGPAPQYPFLQYQYSVSTTYIPGMQADCADQPMLYTMVASGMAS
ncbi:hypothetical protein C8Q78DRAFT_613581 [Trametes maxima]|nr:hypothetical protein C8Q78DRAFT_613581 [Trametes maxima]